MNTILFWTLVLIGSGLLVYFLPYRNIKNVQKLQRVRSTKIRHDNRTIKQKR